VPGDLVAAIDSSPRVIAYGLEATMIDGLVAGEAAVVRTAMLRACAEQHVSVSDVVVGARSVVITHPRHNAEVMRALIGSLDLSGVVKIAPVAAPSVTLAVDYSGPDLDYVAQQCGLTSQEVVTLHSGAKYVVEFCGFSPGFAYLTGLPAVLHLPRRATPRPRVPRGAVAIAAQYSAVYPRESPGGWHLLGVTDHELWNMARDQPATLTPGTIVSFEQIV
jgi:KipI family sensor histidine kinase inhibitor